MNKRIFEGVCKFLHGLLYERTWTVYISRTNPIEGLDLRDCIKIKNPKRSFYADPYILKVGSNFILFVEELLFRTGKGVITRIELDSDFNITSKNILIQDKSHYSFPVLYQKGASWMMTVENVDAGPGLQIYILDKDFSVKESKRIDIKYDIVDPIIFNQQNESFLLFNCDKEFGNYNKNAYVMKFKCIDDISSEIPLRVKSTYVGSRNAGVLNLGRPIIFSQISTVNSYGYGVISTTVDKSKIKNKHNRFIKITPRQITSTKEILGIHTVNGSNGYFVFDVVTYEFNLRRKVDKNLRRASNYLARKVFGHV